MGSADILRLERNGRTVPLSRFYSDFKKDSPKVYYGFVEGKDDPSYYRTIIKQKINSDCFVVLYPSDGKEVVKYVFDEIRSRNYPIDKVVYFMDRDLSNIINDLNIVNDPYVYVTDNYSIENDILNEDTLVSIMQDLLGFCATPLEELHMIQRIYNQQLRSFENKMLPIMANIIMWKRRSYNPANYNNLKIEDIITVKNGILSFKTSEEETIKILYTQSNVDCSKQDEKEVNNIVTEVSKKGLCKQIIRGKYLASFFVLFCNSIYNDCAVIGVKKTHKGRCLCNRDIMETVAPRSRVPQSLIDFIDKTIIQYYKKTVA